MPPSDAKRMSGRVGVCLVAVISIEVGSRLEKSGSESHRLLVRNSGIVDVEIEVDLLRAAIRPVRRTVVRCELHADPPFAGGVGDAVPTVVLEDAPAKDSGPECALRVQVRCVEHDDLTHHSHDRIIDFPKDRRAALSWPRVGESCSGGSAGNAEFAHHSCRQTGRRCLRVLVGRTRAR